MPTDLPPGTQSASFHIGVPSNVGDPTVNWSFKTGTLNIGQVNSSKPLTEAEMARLEGRMDRFEGRVSSAMAELKGGLEASFERLRADMHKKDADMSRWGLATVLTIIATMVVGLGGLFYQLSKGLSEARSTPVASSAPMVIYVQPAPSQPTTPNSKP